jgi:ferritin-like metal-binding protein YciE
MDAAIIGAAQRVEHYEIAAYGTAIAFAELLGEKDHVTLLQETLNEEKETDEKLTELATEVNAEAKEMSAEQEEDRPAPKTVRKKSRRVA